MTGHRWAVALGKLLTPLCLCRHAISITWYSQRAVTLWGWKGDHKYDEQGAIRHGFSLSIHRLKAGVNEMITQTTPSFWCNTPSVVDHGIRRYVRRNPTPFSVFISLGVCSWWSHQMVDGRMEQRVHSDVSRNNSKLHRCRYSQETRYLVSYSQMVTCLLIYDAGAWQVAEVG